MRSKKRLYLFIAGGILLVSIVAVLVVVVVNSLQQPPKKKPVTAGATLVGNPPAPFMLRPYYGDMTVSQRTISFVDHDKPWYVHDNVFVRYDGKRWDHTPIGGCSGGVNCYDGHNGYDLNMSFEPVLSTAAGKIIRAGWYNPLNHNDALGLWVAIDHGNGIVTAYGHLSAITVSIGDQVGPQWQIGTSGTTGSSTGPHLHMATYYLPSWQVTDPFGWTGSYPDPNPVPDRYLWLSNPGSAITIPNLGLTDNKGYAGATIVDDGDQGWVPSGNWARASATTDVHGDLHWTRTSSGAATAFSTWNPDLPADGYYEVATYIDDNHAASSWAPYTIYSSDSSGNEVRHTVYIDQSHVGLFQGPFGIVNTGARWVGLGTYYFKKSMHGRVVLSNATGENGLELAADAIEFVPVNIEASMPSSPQYAFAITGNNTPANLTPGSSAKVTLSVKNTGSATWAASGNNRVSVGYYWQDSSGHAVDQALTGSTTMGALPADVRSGASVSIPLTVYTPMLAGDYQLIYDVQYQGKWLSAQGAKPAISKLSILPSLSRTYYFAEGSTATGVSEQLALTNFAASQANISITYYYARAAPQKRNYQIPAQTHRVLNINNEVGTAQSVGMVVQSDQPFVAQRTMQTQIGSFSATTASMGAPAPASNWYFAEANTTFGWNTLLAVLNPFTHPVQLTLRYQPLQTSQPRAPIAKAKTYAIPAATRSTIVLNSLVPDQQFGMAITATNALVVEKVEYLVKSPLSGGSTVVGAIAPQKTWYFGAGNTTTGFTEVLVLSNPANNTASTRMSYLTTTGKTVIQKVLLPPQKSIQVNVNAVIKQAMHATTITASSPIVAERQDFFSANLLDSANQIGNVAGSTTTIGSDSLHTSWYLPDGNTSKGYAQSLALTNPATVLAQVHIVYYPTTGSPTVKTYTVTASSRQTILLANDVGQNQSVGMAIYASSPIVVEQTVFFNVDRVSGGYAALAYGA
jgi:hypothetical protein